MVWVTHGSVGVRLSVAIVTFITLGGTHLVVWFSEIPAGEDCLDAVSKMNCEAMLIDFSYLFTSVTVSLTSISGALKLSLFKGLLVFLAFFLLVLLSLECARL